MARRRPAVPPMATSSAIDLGPLATRVEQGLAELDAALASLDRDATPVRASGTRPSELAPLLQRAEDAIIRFARHARDERQRASSAEANAAEWERNAMLAVWAKDDDLAREALLRKAECLGLQSSHTREADRLDAELEALRSLLARARSPEESPMADRTPG